MRCNIKGLTKFIYLSLNWPAFKEEIGHIKVDGNFLSWHSHKHSLSSQRFLSLLFPLSLICRVSSCVTLLAVLTAFVSSSTTDSKWLTPLNIAQFSWVCWQRRGLLSATYCHFVMKKETWNWYGGTISLNYKLVFTNSPPTPTAQPRARKSFQWHDNKMISILYLFPGGSWEKSPL